MKQKMLTVLLSATMVMSLVACGNTSSPSSDKESEQDAGEIKAAENSDKNGTADPKGDFAGIKA